TAAGSAWPAARSRMDRFSRLNVFQTHLPPLRDRPDDILLLAQHFLGRFEPRSLPLTSEMARHLAGLPWLGNVRELRNALEHAAIVARGGPLLSEHLPALGASTSPATPAEQLASDVRLWLADRIRDAGRQAPAN